MNLFKRALSSLLAVTMAVACLGAVNVSTVLADTESSWLASDTSTPSWLYVSDGTYSSTGIGAYDGSFTDTIFGTGNSATGAAKNQPAYSFPSGKSFTITTTGTSSTIKLYMLSYDNNESSFNVYNGNEEKVGDVHTVSNRKSTNVSAIEIKSLSADTYKFSVANKTALLFKAVLTTTGDNGTTETTYTYDVNITQLDGNYPEVSCSTTNLSADTTSVELAWAANDSYEAGTKTVDVTFVEDSTDSSKKVATVAVDADWFTAKTTSGGDGEGNTDTTTTGSTYTYNFTTDISSTFYTISGNLSTDKGTAQDTKLKQCLKMESDTSITFKATNAGTLTLVFGSSETSKKVKVDNTDYTTDTNGIVTVGLTAGEHKITKGDTINLFYMSFTESSGTTEGEDTTSTGTLSGTALEVATISAVTTIDDTNVTDGTTINKDTVTKNLTSGTVTFVDAENTTHTATIVDGKYKFTDELPLGDGTLTFNGQSETVTIAAGANTCNVTKTAATHKLTFTTNIKDYKSTFTIADSEGNDIATLKDKTYKDSEGKILRIPSTTHIINVPAGTYTYTYKGNNFTVNGGTKSGTVTVDNSDVSVNLYLTPTTATVDKTLTGALTEGKYVFSASADSDGAVTVAIKKNDADFTNGVSSGIYAEGGNSDGTLTSTNSVGYVVFTIANTYLVQISTADQACALTTSDGSINGTSQAVSVDSGYGSYNIILTPGTYVLKGTTSDAAKIKNIVITDAAVFHYSGSEKTTVGENNSVIVMGSYDHSNDYVGTSDVSNYEKFALFVSTDRDALTYSNINISSSTEDATSSISGDGTTHTVYLIDTNNGKVIYDETKYVYDRVIIDDDKEDVQAKDNKNYYYATILKGVESGTTYYVAGGTWVNNQWLIHETSIGEVTIS